MNTPEDIFRYTERALQSVSSSDASDEEKVSTMYSLVSQFFVALGENEPLHFTTLFARIAHYSNRYAFPPKLTRALQLFRIEAEHFLRKGATEQGADTRSIWVNGAWVLHDTVSFVFNIPKSDTTEQLIGYTPRARRDLRVQRTGFKRHATLVAYGIDEEHDVLIVSDAEGADGDIRLRYGDAGRSELYKDNVLQAIALIGFPLSLSAVDIEITADGSYSPRVIVIEPDYLIDISTLAECYLHTGADARMYLPKKYQETQTTSAILKGKIANYFLDELIHNPSVQFNDLFPRSFFLNPTEFATLSDDEVLHLTTDCRTQFQNLQRVIDKDFVPLGLDRTRMHIEPAFFCPAFGIQGRLDLFQSGPANTRHIVELKSGEPFRANAYGLSSTHYAQTLLYDLMIRAVYGYKTNQASYILYSKVRERTLRYAPVVEAIQREVIRLRNEILLTERALCLQKIDREGLFERITPDAFPEITGYLHTAINDFDKTWNGLDAMEKRYVRIFSRFVAREHFLAKVGMHGSDQINGLAGMWLDTDTEKEERFAICRNLKLLDISGGEQQDAYLIFALTGDTDTLLNFRIGDIAVLYPSLDIVPSVLHTQIYKCTVTGLGAGQITVRLRNRQVTYEDIESHPVWVLEHDLYDSSFNAMHRSLFAFAKATSHQRSLFLGRTAPAHPDAQLPATDGDDGSTQTEMIRKIIAAKDYFLLWGPPGTGKTSVILHHLVHHYYRDTDNRLLLLAYTNRAVDEMCEALDRIGGDIRNHYVRIGSHVSTGEQYRDQLLGAKISGMTKRREITSFLQSQRILIGTVASLSGRPELFRIVDVDIAIVDEASQILEPMLAGILPGFSKWILIGDHKQLPAVVAQPPSQTRLGEEAIAEIALTDPRDSYFERMYLLCRSRGWDWAYGLLSEQGRMHAEIMAFPGKVFYDNRLALLPDHLSNGRDYKGPLHTPVAPSDDVLSQALISGRMLYFPSISNALQQFQKTHDHEARLIVDIIGALLRLYGDRRPSIGIVTPFRAQIANIRAHLHKAGIDPDILSIDTVERYQGSARDIIIMSACVHHPAELQRVVSLSRDGVDRKLNVALTRAREQFILTGDREVLMTNTLYSALCDACREITYTLAEAGASKL